MVRRWSRLSLWLAVIAAAVLIVAYAILVFIPRPGATLANYQRIELGMSQAELHDLLGQPEFDEVQLGLVNGPEGPSNYSILIGVSEAEKRRHGHKKYRWQQWTSAEITIAVVSEPEGGVVCRYSSEGHGRTWLDFFRSWASRWV